MQSLGKFAVLLFTSIIISMLFNYLSILIGVYTIPISIYIIFSICIYTITDNKMVFRNMFNIGKFILFYIIIAVFYLVGIQYLETIETIPVYTNITIILMIIFVTYFYLVTNYLLYLTTQDIKLKEIFMLSFIAPLQDIKLNVFLIIILFSNVIIFIYYPVVLIIIGGSLMLILNSIILENKFRKNEKEIEDEEEIFS